jgi:lysozyme family protein
MLIQDFERWLGKAKKLPPAAVPKTFATDRFPACLPYTLAEECPDPGNWSDPKNFSNDPHDPGGATMCGIIQSEYTDWLRSKGLLSAPVRNITQADGYAIYHDSYWMPRCPTLPAGLDMQVFDSSVNQGAEEATKIMQYVLDVNVDGDWGPLTSAALAKVAAAPLLVQSAVQDFTARRAAVYRQTKGFQYFGKDWLARTQRIGAAALAMAKGA